jgi:regulator of RNase E activity RraA
VPVSVGGMTVRPGDIVVGDQDGLVALSLDEAPVVIEKALRQRDAEEATMLAIREGRWDRAFVDALEARSLN